MQNPNCQLCGAEMVWREGVSKNMGKPYAFWACPTRNPDGSYCKGSVNPKMGHTQPYKPLYRPQTAPPAQVNPQTGTSSHPGNTHLLEGILSELRRVNEKLDWIQNNFVDSQLGTKEREIPIIE